MPTSCPSASSSDRKSTRLNSSHMSISYAVFCLKKKITDERNAPFVEFVKATRLADDTTASGPWFTDLLKLGLLGDGPVSGTDEEVSRKQAWLKQWGYVDPKRGRTKPFETSASG